MRNILLLFGATFILSFGVHTSALVGSDLVDEEGWLDATFRTSQEFLLHLKPGEPIYGGFAAQGYPATPLLFGSALLIQLGIDPYYALRFALTFLLSLGIAAATVVMYVLRPHRWWWLGGGAVLLFSFYYVQSTLATAAALPFLMACILLTLYGVEQGRNMERLPLILFGIVAGSTLSLRFDISAAFLCCSAGLLWFYFTREAWLLVAGTALLTFFICDPYLWFEPISHLTYILHRIFVSYTALVGWNVSFAKALRVSPLAILSFGYAATSLLSERLPVPVPRRFLLWLLGVTTLIISGFLLSPAQFHPMWYFFPFILVWEMFFTFFLLSLVAEIKLSNPLSYLSSFGLERGVALLFCLTQSASFLIFFLISK